MGVSSELELSKWGTVFLRKHASHHGVANASRKKLNGICRSLSNHYNDVHGMKVDQNLAVTPADRGYELDTPAAPQMPTATTQSRPIILQVKKVSNSHIPANIPVISRPTVHCQVDLVNVQSMHQMEKHSISFLKAHAAMHTCRPQSSFKGSKSGIVQLLAEHYRQAHNTVLVNDMTPNVQPVYQSIPARPLPPAVRLPTAPVPIVAMETSTISKDTKVSCPVCGNMVVASYMQRHLLIMHRIKGDEATNILIGLQIIQGDQSKAAAAKEPTPVPITVSDDEQEVEVKKPVLPADPLASTSVEEERLNCPVCSNIVVKTYMERHLKIMHRMQPDKLKETLDDLLI